MKRLILATLIAVPFAAASLGADAAIKDDCSMKASKISRKTDLLVMAKVKEPQAKEAALATAGPGASIVKGGIETEHGCLIYSYHVKDPARTGQTEVLVDAGTGQILRQESEGAMRTAFEKPIDKTMELAGKAKEKVTGEPSTNHAMEKDR
jgi:uncharacterized membrane protein YkoI